MLIKILKTITASADISGTKLKEYKEGEIVTIYQDLAEVFIREKWGIEIDQNQDISVELETQDLKIELQTKDDAIDDVVEENNKSKKGRPSKNADNS